MKRYFLMLLVCVMAFTLVITVSASSGRSLGVVKNEYIVNLASQVDDNAASDKYIDIDTNIKQNTSEETNKNTSKNTGAETIAETGSVAKAGSEFGTGADVESKIVDEAAGTDGTKEEATDLQEKPIEVKPVEDKAIENKPAKSESVNIKFDLASQSLYGSLFLINKANTLDDKFIPQGLEAVSSQASGLAIASGRGNIMLRKDALNALNTMHKAAFSAGIKDMVLTSGYRDYYRQNNLFNRKVSSLVKKLGRKAAEAKASTIVAPAGSSEHQSGLAIDITTKQLLQRSDPHIAEFSGTACGKWMSAHSWEYGYVLRYQYNKMQITGIIYEPWHFRYVGKPHAEIMYKNGFCLEEYVRFLKSKSRLSFTDVSGNEFEIAYVCPPAGTGVLNIVADKGSSVEVSRIDNNGYAVTVKKR